MGQELEIDCIIEAFPKANSYWSKKPLPDDRGHWGDRARWLHTNGNAGRATLYRAKQILQPNPIDESDDTSIGPIDKVVSPNKSPASIIGKIEEDKQQQSVADQSTSVGQIAYPSRHDQLGSSNVDVMMVDDNKKNLISSFGGNFRSAAPIMHTSTQQDRTLGLDRASTPSSSSPASTSKAYVTVRQTPLNTFTYRLRLSIARVQLEDYGEYTCISTNSMGTSESMIMVTSKFRSN